MVLAKVGAERENLSPLMDFNINFVDRQRLKLLEDLVIDLQVIFESMMSYIKGIRNSCERYCKKLCSAKDSECDCIQVMDQLDLHIAEVELHIARAKILRDRAGATAQLVSLSSSSSVE